MRPQIALLVILRLLTSCNVEVDINAPGGSLPVVFCFLDPEDSVQYIRVGRTWSVEPGDTLRSPDPEQILIDDQILIYMSEEISSIQQKITEFYPDHTLSKDSGWFSNQALQLYSAPCRIMPNRVYSIYVHFIESNIIVHGTTRSLGPGFDIIDPDLVPDRYLTLFPEMDFYVRFSPLQNGSVFQSMMTFHYLDMMGTIFTPRSIAFPQKMLFENDLQMSFYALRVSGERFYIDLNRMLQPVEGVKRIPLGMDFMISAGGDDLALKIQAENETGLFSILEVNSFDNAIGIFSSLVHKKINGVPLSHLMLDSLALNPLTRNLGFLTSSEIDSIRYEYE